MIIEKIDYTKEPMLAEYYDCTFRNCDFHELMISNTRFENCEFIECNFSLAVFTNAVYDAIFDHCHMLGCSFAGLNAFSGGLQFIGCNLNYSNYSQIRMKGMHFSECQMMEASFADAEVKNSTFAACNLERTDFDGADITQCDFATSYNYTVNPTRTKLRKARFSKDQLEGLVAHLGIVVC